MKQPVAAPLVTIITATYNLIKANRGEDVARCIEAVHSQDYPKVEHLIIDGGSTDGTLELLKPYEEKGWLKIYSEPDKGIYDAFNKGIARASGKYINFMNSDDYFAVNNAVTLSVNILEKSKADISYSDWWQDDKPDLYRAQLPKLIFSMPFCHQTAFCKTSLLREMGGFGMKYKIASDREFLFRAFLQGQRFVKVKTPLVVFHAGGYSAVNIEQTVADDYQLFKEYTEPLYPFTEDELRNCFDCVTIPTSVLRQLIASQSFLVRWTCYIYNLHYKFYLLRQRLKTLRHWVLTLRTRKGHRIFRVLGINLINEEQE